MGSKAYSGNGKPFLYAFFAPQDKESAEETILQLWEKELEVWPSERFDRRRIDKSALVLLFLSPEAAQCEETNRVINYVTQTDHPMLAVHLSPTALTPAQRLMLNSQQAMFLFWF